jgi:SAM-dependent MidA family methyltransferase
MFETIPNAATLAARLLQRIRNEGPIPFADWMRAALYDPQDGYYCRSDRTRWGRKGDYRTSPERSSLFAATLARYFAFLYEDLGRPASWTISEAGAGDGQFAVGVLQTLQRSFPQVFAATSYVIDEVSSHSRTFARERLQAFADRVGFKDLVEAEIDSGIVFSNELFDAFPVHLVTIEDGKLQELYVDVDENGQFKWLLGAVTSNASARILDYFEKCGIELAEGQVAEVNLEIEDWLRKVAAKIRKGYVVTVDYGLSAEDLNSRIVSQNGTLRGFHRHEFVDDLLARPGEQDLTTTINWSFVKSVGRSLGLETAMFERLDRFLLTAGFLEQLAIESHQCEDDAERIRMSTAAREMILPNGMASHFQVLVQKRT